MSAEALRADVAADIGAGAWKPGLQAVAARDRRDRIVARNTRKLSGSVALDDWFRRTEPDAPRWDYLVGFESSVHWVEVHGASGSDVSVVLEKLAWLEARVGAWPHLGARAQSFHWVATSGVDIPKQSRQYRQAAARGLLPKKQLALP